MDKIMAFFASEMGRRIGVWISVALGTAAQGGLIPLDYAIPFLGITTGKLLVMLGIVGATTSGSNSRK